MHYFIGLALALSGAVLIIKTEWFIANFGSSAWAEAKFGTEGGTRLLYKLIGLGTILIGFIVITNLWEGFLAATVGKIFIR